MTTSWVSVVLLGRGHLILSNDPPPIFYVHALVFGAFRPLISPDIWQLLISTMGFTPPGLLQGRMLNSPGIAMFMTLLKLPYLIFDLATAVLLLWTVENPKTALSAMRLWLFNPIVLYTSYFAGQFDVVPVFFLLLAYHYCKSNRRIPSAAALAIAIAFKLFAIVLVPLFLFLWLHEDRDVWKKTKTLVTTTAIVALAVGVIVLIPLLQHPYYESANLALPPTQLNGFFGTTFYNRGEKTTSALAQGIITFLSYSAGIQTLSGFGDVVLVAPLVYGIVILGFLYLRQKGFLQLWSATTILFLGLYASSLFHPQWFLWVQPFLIVFVALDKKRLLLPYVLLMATFFLYTLYWDTALTTVPLIPAIPAAAQWPGPWALMAQAGFPPLLLVNVARSVFSGLALFMAFLVVRIGFFPQGVRVS